MCSRRHAYNYRQVWTTTSPTTAAVVEDTIDTGYDDQRGQGREQQAEENRACHRPPDRRTAADAKAGGCKAGDGGQRGQDDWPQTGLDGGNYRRTNRHALGALVIDKANQHD